MKPYFRHKFSITLAALALVSPFCIATGQTVIGPSDPPVRGLLTQPVANDGAVRTKPERSVFITLEASNNTDSGLQFTIVAPPAHGRLTDYGFIAYSNAGGAVTPGPASAILPPVADMTRVVDMQPIFLGGSAFQSYVPATGFIGVDSFTFKATNSAGDSNLATVTITVTDQNLPPVAQPQALSVKLGGKVWVYLYGSDPDNDVVNCSAATQPAHGTLRMPNASDFEGWFWPMVTDAAVASESPIIHPIDPMPGVYVYEPSPQVVPSPLPADWTLEDSFTFTANDGSVDSAPATVTITIHPSNRAPVAVAAVSPAVEAWATRSEVVVIANNNKTADIILDATSSTDADGDWLWANWFERKTQGKPAANVRLASTETPIGWGIYAGATLTIGSHTIVGHVTDGTAESQTSFAVKVITPGDAVVKLNIALRTFGAPGKIRPLLAAPVTKAIEFCRKGKFEKAKEQLQAFKGVVAEKLTAKYPTQAAQFTDLADAILEALSPQPQLPVIMY